jgi:hypothetical protein
MNTLFSVLKHWFSGLALHTIDRSIYLWRHVVDIFDTTVSGLNVAHNVITMAIVKFD